MVVGERFMNSSIIDDVGHFISRPILINIIQTMISSGVQKVVYQRKSIKTFIYIFLLAVNLDKVIRTIRAFG